MNKFEFTKLASDIHLNKYRYDEVKERFKDTDRLRIICPIHGRFKVSCQNHLMGQGCPLCGDVILNPLKETAYSTLEERVSKLLDDNSVKYIRECDSSMLWWLGKLKLDFYIPSMKTAIECQGVQHFKPIEHFGGTNEFKNILERDGRKKSLCEEFGVKILYFGNKDDDASPYRIITEERMLMKELGNL